MPQSVHTITSPVKILSLCNWEFNVYAMKAYIIKIFSSSFGIDQDILSCLKYKTSAIKNPNMPASINEFKNILCGGNTYFVQNVFQPPKNRC